MMASRVFGHGGLSVIKLPWDSYAPKKFCGWEVLVIWECEMSDRERLGETLSSFLM